MKQEEINFELIRSDRSTCQIQVKTDGRVIVRVPKRMPEAQILAFVNERAEWIEKALNKAREARAMLDDQPPLSEADVDRLADKAIQYLPDRVAMFAERIGVEYGRITVRNQKTRWGSCSGKGNLNFNCLLMLTPPKVIDYVIVHELCHLKEMNHSKHFWAEVEAVIPDYKESRLWLKKNGGAIIGRMK